MKTYRQFSSRRRPLSGGLKPAGACWLPALAHCVLFGLVLLAVGWPRMISAQPAPVPNPWRAAGPVPQGLPAPAYWVNPPVFRAVALDHVVMAGQLGTAPQEAVGVLATGQTVILLPMPDGTDQQFRIVEAPVMALELAAKFPEIKTYLGQGIDDPSASVRLDLTPAGFHAQVLSPNGAVYIDPHLRDRSVYASYYKRDYRALAEGFKCLTPAGDDKDSAPLAPAGLLRSGANLRTYKLACAANGEYTAYHGGTVASGLAAVVTAVNRVTGIFEQELAIRLVLVGNNNLLIFTNPNTDPYDNTDDSQMLAANQVRLDDVIGSANYDIGHVFSTGAGGRAGVGVVCLSGFKAHGVTGTFPPTGDAFWVDFVAHEMGHQFGGTHTFNSSAGNCAGNRSAGTAYERGSGSTIMAYAGICSADNVQTHSDPFFHAASFDQMLAYTTVGGGSGCADTAPTGNTVPTVSAGPNYTIPQNTPFTLTATGSDPDGDPLTYCWEQRDLGASTTVDAPDNGSSPLFRSWSPTTSPARTFPRLQELRANELPVGEVMPTTTRTLRFRVTARDNRAGGGGVNTSDMQVSVVAAAGPFTVTSHAAGGTFSNYTTVTWDVAGTTNSPVNATHVNILLSTNGGLTFPITLAANTPNDGSQSVLLPNINTTAARLKVAAADNIFFDLNHASFRIIPGLPIPSLVCPGDLLRTNTAGLCGAVVAYTVTSDSPVVSVPASGTFFPVGSTTVNCTASNAAGLVATCSFQVTVVDGQAPVVVCPANLITNAPNGSNSVQVFFTATATDNCGVVSTNSVPPSGSFFPLGTNLVTCTARDAAGNSNTCTFNLIVRPTNLGPDMVVVGNGFAILAGDNTPSAADHTDFGSVSVSSGTVVRTFTIQNLGIQPLNLTGTPRVSVSGANAGDFAVTAQPASPVATNGATTFQVTFNPSAAGLRTAALSVANDDPFDNPYTFVIQGDGVDPEIAVGGNSVNISNGDTTPSAADHTDFGSVSVSSGTLVRTFAVQNLGTAPLSLTGSPRVVVGGTHAADFTVTLQPAASVAAGDLTTFQVTFNPSASGLRSATLSLANNDADENPFNFAIQGTGIDPALSVLGNGLLIADGDTTPSTADGTDFGSRAVAALALVRTFTVTNSGNAALTLSNLTLSDGQATEFLVGGLALPTTLAANGSAAFTVTFIPRGTGLRATTLSLGNSDAARNPYTFTLQGTGTSDGLNADNYRLAVLSEAALAGFYPVDGDTSPTLTDRHLPAQNGKLVNGATLSSATGTVGTHSLQASHVNLGTVAAYQFSNGVGTVEAVLYQTNGAGYDPCFFACRSSSGVTRYSLHGDAGAGALHFWNGGDVATFPTPLSMLNRRVHVAFVFSNQTVRAYFNGASLGVANLSLGIAGQTCQIGASDPANTEAWLGRIDEVAVYTNAQSAASILARYQALTAVNAAPTIACPGNLTTNNAPGQCVATNVAFAVTATGLPTPTVVCRLGGTVITSPYNFPVGTNVVTCTASNSLGTATCSFTVTVRDTQPPSIVCPGSLTTNTPVGSNSVPVSFAVTASDLCGAVTVTSVPASGSYFPLGSTVVTNTARDAAGNSNTCTFTVTVLPGCAPLVTVLNTNDSGPGSLRQALRDVCAGGTIAFAPALNGQTIGLTSGELLPDRDVAIAGPGANLLAISGNGSSRVLFVNSSVNVLLAGLTLTRGNGAGSAPSGYGGSLYNQGTLTVSNCTLTGNSALDGGALKNVEGAAYLVGTTVSSNSASFGGGLYSFNGLLTLVNCTVSGNTAAFHGSGIYNQGPLTARNSTLTGNRAGASGVGALFASGTERLTNCIIAGNFAGSGTTPSDLGGAAVDSAACNLIGSTGLGATNGNLVLSNTLAITRILDTNLAFNGGPTRTHALLPGSPAIDAGTNGAIAGLAYDQRGVGFPRMAGSRVDIGAHERQASDSPFAEVQLAGLPGVVGPALAWGDYDNDGRLDLLLTGYSPSHTNQISQLWRNTGTGFTQVPIAGLPGVAGGAVAWGDYDNDGRLDFLLTGYGYSQLWRNTGSGFTQVPIPGLLGVVNSAVAWGDYDNDGRLDFLLTGGDGGSSNVSQLWRNTGAGFTQVSIPGLPAVGYGSLAWGDYDSDGRLDFLITGIGTGVGSVAQLWRNTGSGFTQVAIPGLPGVWNSSVAWGDYDNDGRLDFFLTGNQISQLWRNTGSGFAQVPVPGLPGVADSSAAWGDYDHDGRLDLLLGGSSILQVWRNTGSGFTNLLGGLPALSGRAVGWADYDNDGRLDFLVAGQTPSGGAATQLWKNYSTASNTPPTAPTGLAALARGTNSVTLSWNPASDAQTPVSGLTYNLVLGTSAGAVDLASPHANVASGFRRVVRLGAVNAGGTLAYTFTNLPAAPQYFWSVQALDTALTGGPFAPAQSFILRPTEIAVASATDGGPGSLRDALACIAPGGTITFSPALHGQTLVLTGGILMINRNLNIIGPGADQLAISGDGSSGVFLVNPGVTSVVAGLTIANGTRGFYNTGNLTVSNCTVSGHSVSDQGGAGLYNDAGTLTVLNSTVSGNSIVGNGGYGAGVANRSGTVLVLNSTISSNLNLVGLAGETLRGGGLYNGDGTMVVRHCTLSGNESLLPGSAIFQNGTNAWLQLGHTLLASSGSFGSNFLRTGGVVVNDGFNLANDASAGLLAPNAGNLLLAPLADNGGPTRTHALLPGSPAIDAGAGNLPNAWQIADVTSALNSGGIAYNQTLTPVQRTAATNAGWHFTVVSRMVAGSGGDGPAHFMVYGNGVRRFAVAWDLNAAGQLTATMDVLGTPLSTNLTTAGAAGTNYHQHDLVYNPVTAQATYLFDGTPIRTWSGESVNAQNGLVWWGGVSSLGRGRMNYHRAKFAINGLGTVAEYLAGFQGYPASAPNPTNQGWDVVLPGTPGAVTNAPVSPDALALQAGQPLFAGLDFDQRGPGYPRLIGNAVDIGAFEFHAASAVPTLPAIGRTPAGLQLQVRGAPNQVLSLQWNSRPGPGGWQPLSTIATDGLGWLDYTDTTAAGQPMRFYRAVRP